MSQPLAIYASISASDPLGPEWMRGPNHIPVNVANPYPGWTNFNWHDGNISPTSGYGENPDYLWSQPIADPTDGIPRQFTRRLTADSSFTAKTIPAATGLRFILTVAADDEYGAQLLTGIPPHPLSPFPETPSPGFNNTMPWRNAKTYVYGVPLSFGFFPGQVLDLQFLVRNIPTPPGTPPDHNPAMFHWIMQIFR